MMRKWIAVALLASSWLLGLGYFDPTNMIAWLCTLIAAVLLLADVPLRPPSPRQRFAILLLLAPTLWFTPLPYIGIADWRPHQRIQHEHVLERYLAPLWLYVSQRPVIPDR